MAAEKCLGLAGKLAGHNYQPRYSKGAPTLELTKLNASAQVLADIAELLEASKTLTYHGDICTRCGDKVFRNVERL